MMKCKIARNEGITFILLLTYIAGITGSYLSSFASIQDLCSSNRYIYSIKPDEPQELKLTYNTTEKKIDKWYLKSKRKCRKEFKTINGGFHFVVVVSNMSIPSCSDKCQCNFFELAEPGNTVKFCGENKEQIYFESKSDYLSIEFQHGPTMPFEVILSFTVERNAYIITGLPKEAPLSSGHFIESPYFPSSYPADYTSEYFFHTDAADGRVMLLFLDFQISSVSYIEVVGHNQTIPERLNGDVFRPPVFVSQNGDLTLKFDANSHTGNSGFRAVAYFLKSADVPAVKPFTDCGGSKFGYGGILVLETAEMKLFDCLWHIVTPIFSEAKSNLLTISNISLIDVGSNASLEFREGRNSKSKIVKTIDCAIMNCSSLPFEVTVSAYNGLYVRFVGKLQQFSFVGMVYSTYRNGNCSSEQSYCQGRCLPPILICDGVKHCPDGSDELECTKTTEVTPTLVPNPTVEKKTYSNTGTSFYVILSFGICGLIVLAFTVFLLVYKGAKTLSPNELAEEPEVIAEMTGHPSRTSSVHTTSDNLPSYEDFVQTTDRYPPLFYTRAARLHSEPPCPFKRNVQHTTSFCKLPNMFSQSDHSSSSNEALFMDHQFISPEPSCSYERNDIANHMQKLDPKKTPGMKRTWQSDTKLDQLDTSDCHLHLSITHCTSPYNSCQCNLKQYYSLPINFKINNCKNNDISIILPNNAAPKVNFGQSRHLSFNCNSNSPSNSKIVTIKTRCHSDPCQFRVHYAVYP